jgi:hypothetical protein
MYGEKLKTTARELAKDTKTEANLNMLRKEMLVKPLE